MSIPCFLPFHRILDLTKNKMWVPVSYRYGKSQTRTRSLLFFSFLSLTSLSRGPSSFPCAGWPIAPVFFFFFVDLHILLTVPFPDAEHGRMRTGKDIWTMQPPSMSVLFSLLALLFKQQLERWSFYFSFSTFIESHFSLCCCKRVSFTIDSGPVAWDTSVILLWSLLPFSKHLLSICCRGKKPFSMSCCCPEESTWLLLVSIAPIAPTVLVLPIVLVPSFPFGMFVLFVMQAPWSFSSFPLCWLTCIFYLPHNVPAPLYLPPSPSSFFFISSLHLSHNKLSFS